MYKYIKNDPNSENSTNSPKRERERERERTDRQTDGREEQQTERIEHTLGIDRVSKSEANVFRASSESRPPMAELSTTYVGDRDCNKGFKVDFHR
eukprot:274961-Amorphochlora_amoeboformis.AAC.1